jgi:hypothetical protein
MADMYAKAQSLPTPTRYTDSAIGNFETRSGAHGAGAYVSREFSRIAGGLIAGEWICSGMAALVDRLG